MKLILDRLGEIAGSPDNEPEAECLREKLRSRLDKVDHPQLVALAASAFEGFFAVMQSHKEYVAMHERDDEYREAISKIRRIESILTSKIRVYRAKKSASSEFARKGAIAKRASSPADKAMREIEGRFMAMLRKDVPHMSYSDFARKMIMKYPEVTSEGSIKNACTRWSKNHRAS